MRVSRSVCAACIGVFIFAVASQPQDHSAIADSATDSGVPEDAIAPIGAGATGAPLPVEKGFIRVRLRDGSIQDVHKPTFREVADRNFWLVVAGTYATSILDIEGEQHCHSVNPNCIETNPLLGPRRVQQYGVKMPLNALFVWGLYHTKRAEMIHRETGGRERLPKWLVLGETWTALNLATSIHNWTLKPPQ